MKTILTIIKKEFARFFKDTRLWITAILLPGLLIFAVYNLMGTFMNSVGDKDSEVPPTAVVIKMPASMSAVMGGVFDLKVDTEQNAKEAVKEGELNLLIIFPDNFDELVAAYVPSPDVPAPNVEIYYDSSDSQSAAAFGLAHGILTAYEDAISNKFDINRPVSDGASFDMATEQSTSRMILSMIVPMVLLMLLFSGCMAVAPESIAGEKERGTIATLLVTPVKRSYIAIGKIVALSAIALLSGLSSSLGLLFSLPKLVGEAGSGISLSLYGFGDYVSIFGVVLSTVLILVTMIGIVSAYAKSVKEASGLVVPLMLLTMVCGLLSIFASGLSSIGLFFIPLFNSALVISSILSGTVAAAAVAVTICVNLAFTALLVLVLTLMFKSERIMFNK